MQFHLPIPQFGTVPLAVMACVVFSGASCAEGFKGQSQSKQPITIQASASQPELYGGDQLSWLTGAGDNADSNFCNTRLELPLATGTTWEYSYTDAVFSADPPDEIVHFDGVLAISARSSQLLGLDANTGELLFNKDVYFNSGHPERTKRIQSLFFHPRGLLGARDGRGRVYCWEITDGNLTESWVYQAISGRGGVVAGNENFYAAGGSRIQGLNAISGEVELEYPSMLANTPLLMSGSGLIVCWQYYRTKLIVFDSQTGHTKWVTFFDDFISSTVLGDEGNCVYVTTTSDRLSCLDLQTGEQLWDYDYAWLLDQATRQERAKLLGNEITRILPMQPIVGPWGFCLPFSSGDVLLFSSSGELKWHYQADSSVTGAIGFTNAILIKQFWEAVDEFPRPRFDPFNLTRPDWNEINAKVETNLRESEDEVRSALTLGMFARIVALDIENGTELDAFEPDEFTYGRFIPAYNNIILTKVKGQRQAGSRQGLAKWIVAYNWLEEGSK